MSDEADGLAALTLIDLGDRAEVRRALRTALKIRPRDLSVFEELFDRLWTARTGSARLLAQKRSVPVPGRPRPQSGSPRPRPDRDPALETPMPEGEEPGYSPEAVLRRKPFDELSPADLLAMERLLARLALRLATRKSRRRVPSVRGEIDLRRSFRRALAHGGEYLSLARRARAIKEPRLVVLCDTSGSMDPHARFLLAFMLALRRVAKSERSSEIFAFNTSLVRLTPLLRTLAPERLSRVLERLAAEVPDWAGGTRIGECLAEFVDHHLDQRVDARTVVIILSDGLDRGDIAPLADAMRAIHSRARRVLWLNPLAGDLRYEPTARAMAAALPYVDQLLPAHNLASLERLLPLLAA
jgi:uncharacterized protein with von Willebrand factor type A (vWA) domain